MANITLLSDLGVQDAAAGIVKGMLYSWVPDARITDISHEVTPFDTVQAAYVLGSAYSSFPKDTVHVVLVDIFAEADTLLLLAVYDGHYFLVPDNGILQMALGDSGVETWVCPIVSGEHPYDAWMATVAGIINGLSTMSPAQLRLRPLAIEPVPPAEAAVAGPEVLCRILHIDKFGNVVTDMTRDRFDMLNHSGNFSITIGGDTIRKVSNYYTDAIKGDPLCRFNRRGYLEICVNKGDASAVLGLRIGGIPNDIKIIFE
ncbi:S-adenosyl-l-methionine hydroxide adenosyltransferase family protein [Nemorincola caseinilytica]|uniref:S-adenosyl-l-methionine hydroxide adenosyltransferase family protein n=1 Tax=Nemorincola caseinilytica TaxID=2054315 RepID=A0ABP8NHG4_9BACT